MKQALRDALDDRGYSTLTPVQTAVLDTELNGCDLLVSAQTGSGKTLGFGLAIAPTILEDAERFNSAGAPLALVIAPTRELALQVKRELSWLFAKAGAIVASCVGGMDMRDERRSLGRGAHIVVATPGRLRDHIMRGSIDLTSLRSVVLDEADEMLDLGFREDLEFILGESPDDRQTLMFSATVPKSIAKLAESYQKDAVRVVTKSEKSQHADIEYRAMMVAERDTENAVINALLYYKAPNAIVFGNTRAMVNRLTTRLSNRGFQVVALSGELSQSERTHALQAMRDGRAQVCVATDVAARGIDLPNLDLVVHAELPSNHETLLHRSGRTGRAGRKGVSALIVTKKSRKKAERILGMAKLKAEWGNAPSAGEVNAREEERMFADPSWQIEKAENEEDTVGKLLSTFEPEQVALAYLRLYRSVRSAPEELSNVDAKPTPRAEFGPSIWFSVSGGRKADAEPRRLLPMLCKASNLTKDDIGAIRIQEEESFVQILETSVPAFLAAIGPKMTVEENAVIKQLDKPPVITGSTRSARPDRSDRPDRKGSSKPAHRGKPESSGRSPHKSNGPIDWNDDPAPRKKKPKPQDRPTKPQARRDAPDGGGKRQGSDASPHRQADGAVTPRKPRSKSNKGPQPPAGKASSKKNRARAAVAKGASKQGGNARPKRPKT
ncbi:MAG: DEAD/DEAH box helicase [Paracoccaceae bacterium]